MSNRGVRWSQSASFFDSSKRIEVQNVKGKKALRQEEDPPTILVNETSTSMLVEEPTDINVNLLAPTM